MTPKEPPVARPRLVIRLHMPSFLRKSIDETRDLLHSTGESIDEDGWLEVAAAGYRFSEATRLEHGKVGDL